MNHSPNTPQSGEEPLKWDLEFLVGNMLAWTGFEGSKRRSSFEALVAKYNTIVAACEADPSLMIEIA